MDPTERPDDGRREPVDPADLPETQAMPVVEREELVEDRVYEALPYETAVVDDGRRVADPPRSGWPIVLGLLLAVGLIVLVLYLVTNKDDTPSEPTVPSSTTPTTASVTRPSVVTTVGVAPATTVRVTTTTRPATTSSSSTSTSSTSTSTTTTIGAP